MEMLDELGRVEPSTPAWAFGPEQVVGFWETRMLVETGVHRWDAEQAFGEPDPLPSRVAEAGLDEFGDLWFPQIGEVTAVEFVASDLGRTWNYGSGETVTTLTDTGSNLYLRLASRPSPVELPPDWAAGVDGLAPPPKR